MGGRSAATPSRYRSPCCANVTRGKNPVHLHNSIQSVHRYLRGNRVNARVPSTYAIGLCVGRGGTELPETEVACDATSWARSGPLETLSVAEEGLCSLGYRFLRGFFSELTLASRNLMYTPVYDTGQGSWPSLNQ